MKKVGKLIGANQQFSYAHRIQLGVIDVLYKKKYGTEEFKYCGYRNFGFRLYTDNEDNDNVIVEDIAIEEEIVTNQELLPIINKVRNFFKIFKRPPTKNVILQKYILTENKTENTYVNIRFLNTLEQFTPNDRIIFETKKSNRKGNDRLKHAN
ncbi:hypothetical protein TNCV_956131 [Trichonephila clavipes]|nr:hypothetical protein TNCV_956131 [Trichonephila clavipes]